MFAPPLGPSYLVRFAADRSVTGPTGASPGCLSCRGMLEPWEICGVRSRRGCDGLLFARMAF